LREETVSKYPHWATRELLMNAVMHRDYECNAPVQFYEYDDRIEVLNPGRLYGKVSPDNFPNISDYRNPCIAEAIKILGYVNRFSRGVYRVQKELVENGNGEASFDFSLITAFRVVEKISERYFEEVFGAKKTPKKIQGNVLKIIKTNPKITVSKLSELLDHSQDSVRHHLRQLTAKGIIKHEGSTKAGKWTISNLHHS
jgi:ATP-dependent DNA helicase RecG